MVAAAMLKMEKSPYPRNGLADHHEIWHNDAVWHWWQFRPLKFRKIKNPRWRRPPSWKIEKNGYICATVWPKKFAWWRRLTILILPTIRFQTGSRNEAVNFIKYKRILMQFSLLDLEMNGTCRSMNFTRLTSVMLLHYLVKFKTAII